MNQMPLSTTEWQADNIVVTLSEMLDSFLLESKSKGPVTPPPRNEKTIVQSKISSLPILFIGTRKLDDFQDRQPTDFLPPRKILTNQREVQ